jgi:hypothetical protein
MSLDDAKMTMHYTDTREKIQSGDVLAWTHRQWDTLTDLQSQAVRIATMSEYSHIGIAWVIAGRVFVLEAVGSGVRIFPLSRAGAFYWMPRAIWDDEKEQVALLHVGEPYSKIDAIRSFFGASDPTDGMWFCSEYVCVVLGLDVEKQTPAEVIRYLQDVEGLILHSVQQ